MSSSKRHDKRRPLVFLREFFSNRGKSNPGQPTLSTSASSPRPSSSSDISSTTIPTTARAPPTTTTSALELSRATHVTANPTTSLVSLPTIVPHLTSGGPKSNALHSTLSPTVVLSVPIAQTVAVPSRRVSSSSLAGSSAPTLESLATSSPDQRAKKAGGQRIIEVLSTSRTLLSMAERALDGLPIYGPKVILAVLTETLKVAQVG
jgi:hypothetical protein